MFFSFLLVRAVFFSWVYNMIDNNIIKLSTISEYTKQAITCNKKIQVVAMWKYNSKLWADTYLVDRDGNWWRFDSNDNEWSIKADITFFTQEHIKEKIFIGHYA